LTVPPPPSSLDSGSLHLASRAAWGGGNYFTEMCSGSEACSYLRLIDCVYHSTLGLRVIKKKKEPRASEGRGRNSRSGAAPGGFHLRSNRLVQALDLYWRFPERGGLWCTSRQLERLFAPPLIRSGLVLKAHRLLYHSTLGSRAFYDRIESDKEEDVCSSF